MIEVNKSSDSEIDKFLAEEDPVSFGPHPNRPYNFVDNLPPCLQDNPEFPGVQLCNKSTIRMEGPPIHNLVRSDANATQSQCDVCLSWINRYYTDVPFLQSRVKFLKDQVDVLTNKTIGLNLSSKGRISV
jgi:hypothetical protein